jgi:hypothetical protein
MRRVLAGAGLVLVAGMTTACGGSPDDASKDDFCKAIHDVPIADDGKVKQDDWDDWLDKINDTGTPEDISNDERDGFETSIDVLGDLDVEEDSEDISKAIEEAEDDLDDDEKKNVEKFDDYVNETCPPTTGG